MLSLQALYAEVARVLPVQRFTIEVEIWRGRTGRPEVSFSIWDGRRNYAAATPDGALAALRAAHGAAETVALESVSVEGLVG